MFVHRKYATKINAKWKDRIIASLVALLTFNDVHAFDKFFPHFFILYTRISRQPFMPIYTDTT